MSSCSHLLFHPCVKLQMPTCYRLQPVICAWRALYSQQLCHHMLCMVLFCRYKPFLVVEAHAEPGEGGVETAEALLREYLEGSNDRKLAIDLTTPLFRDSDDNVSYMLPGNQVRCSML